MRTITTRIRRYARDPQHDLDEIRGAWRRITGCNTRDITSSITPTHVELTLEVFE